jgi:excisionase family DNA binding protein
VRGIYVLAMATAEMRGNMAGKITVERLGADVIRLTMVADIQIAGASGELAGRTSGAADAGSLDAVGGGEPGAGGHQLFTVDQVAEILSISRDMVYDLLRRGQLRSIKVRCLRRISGQWVDEFVERTDNAGL